MKQRAILCLIAVLALALAAPEPLPPYLGKSYDVLLGNPLSDQIDPGFKQTVFDFSFKDGVSTEDGKYLIPDGVSQQKGSSCSLTPDVRVHRGSQSYQDSLKTRVSIPEGSLSSQAFSASNAFTVLEKLTSADSISFTQATAECQAYKLSLGTTIAASLFRGFAISVQDAFNSGSWANFIAQFGTHFVSDLTFGGRVTQQISYTSNTVSELAYNKIEIDNAAKASFAQLVKDSSVDTTVLKDEISYARTYSRIFRPLYVGTPPPQDGSAWNSQVSAEPMPIRYGLRPLSDLFSRIKATGFDATKAVEQFTQALTTYCSSVGCKTPVADKPKPASASVVEKQTPGYGGTSQGTKFSWKVNSATMQARKFYMMQGGIIENLKIEFSDGAKTEISPPYGGPGGKPAEWTVPEGQYVKQVIYKAGSSVDSLTFVTNTGERSPKFGGDGGKDYQETFPDGYRLVGFFGYQGRYVHQLGFILAKTVYSSNGLPAHTFVRRHLLKH